MIFRLFGGELSHPISLQTRHPLGGDIAEQQAQAEQQPQSGRAELDAANRASPHIAQMSARLSTCYHDEFSATGFFQCRQIGLHQLP